jgi:ribosomal protein S18 acetylase RimI-like enzyme
MNAADCSFEIRVARLEDALAIAGLLGELGFPAPADVVAQRLSVLAKAGETTLVGARSGEVLGFVTVHVTPVLHRPAPVGRMTALVVATRARGRGLGRALVATAERRLADAGCGLMEVTSNQELSEAHSFYQQLGYAMTSYRFGKALPPSR